MKKVKPWAFISGIRLFGDLLKQNLTKISKIREWPHNCLFWLILITIILSTYIWTVQVRIGVPYWDVFNYLNNALNFAGIGTGGITYLPPLIPSITSIFFRMGFVSESVIFFIHLLFHILGILGFYLLLKTRFSKLQSFSGAIIYLSLSVILPWAASGGIDIPAVTLSIWTVYFLVKGLRDKPVLLYLVLPTLALAVTARYTAGLLVIPLIFYLIMERPNSMQWKKIFLGFLVTFLVSLPFAAYFFQKIGDINAIISLIINTAIGASSGADDVAFNPNYWFYFQNLPKYLAIGPLQGTYNQLMNPSQAGFSTLGLLIFGLSAIGLLIYTYQNLKSKIIEIRGRGLKSRRFVLSCMFIFLIIVGLFLFSETSYLVIEAIFFGICYLGYLLFRSDENQTSFNIDLMILSWFGTYFIFHSILPIKVDRYFITMAPAFVYFLMLGLREFWGSLSVRLDFNFLKSSWIYVIIALMLLASSTATYVGHTPKKIFVLYLDDASDWIKTQDPSYQEKIIFSDYPNAMSWYLRMDVKGAFPRHYSSIKDFRNHLVINSADYYVDSLSDPKPDLEGYVAVKNFQMVTIYKKSA